MKKCVSIIMALIVLFSASVYSGVIPASAKMPVTITASVNAKAHKVKKHKHRHKVPKGNMGKWFKSRKALKKHVNKVMKYWADKEECGEITREEYYKNALTDMKFGRVPVESGPVISNMIRRYKITIKAYT
ncbi:MAG: hypothetical protein IJ643_06155 [Eubacterium sp.]|nr:hypothetical protein [Eubacterium sp.]